MSLRLLLLCVCLVPVSGTTSSIVVAQTIEGPHPLFQPDRVSEITLQFTEGEWGKLQPSEDIDWDIGRAFGEIISDASQGTEFRGGDENRPGLGGYLGLNHQYGKATHIYKKRKPKRFNLTNNFKCHPYKKDKTS